MKAEISQKFELERELRKAHENEAKAIVIAEEDDAKLRQECEKLTKELAEMQKKVFNLFKNLLFRLSAK